MRFTSLFIAFALSLTLLAGCGPSKNPFGAVYLEGTVTLDGSPIEGVNVNLIPRGGDLTAGGLTDATGKFTVTIAGSEVGTGAKPGEYDVTFSKVEVAGQDLSFDEFMKKYGNKQPETTYLVPQKYGSPQTSGVEPITVSTKKANNKFTFALTSQ